MLLQRIEIVFSIFTDTAPNNLLINVQLQSQGPDESSNVFTDLVSKLLDEIWYPNGMLSPFVGFPDNENIVLLLSNSHTLTKILLHPIAEALRKLVKRCNLRSGTSVVKTNRNDRSFVIFHPLQHMHNRKNRSES